MNTMDNHIKKIKVGFLAAIALICIIIVLGTTFSDELINPISRETRLTFNYFKNVISFNKETGKNLLASLTFLNNNNGNDISNKLNTKNTNSIPVLVYHGIVDENPDRFSLTKDRFKEHLFALKKAGYETVSMEDFHTFLKGEKELPGKSFVLTFDDGRKDSYYPADPLLKALAYKAVMFVATGASLPETPNHSKYYLSQKELERMVKSGRWDIQSHAVQIDGGFIKINSEQDKGNFLSNKMFYESDRRLENDADYKKRIGDEFANSKKTIEEKLRGKVISFSYPFGDYGQQTENYEGATDVISELVKQNYEMAFRQIWPKDSGFSFNYKGDYPYMLKRIEPSPEWSGEYLVEYLSGGEGKNLPYEEKFSNENQWKRTWGQVDLSENKIELSSREDTSGSFIFLDGSYPWTDYIFNTAVDWIRGSHISLAARFKDEENYVSCVFSDDNIRIEQKIVGKTRNIVDKKNIYDLPKENLRLGISVAEDIVRCYVNGNEVAYAYYLSPVLANGGIGIKTWDKELGNSEIIVKKVSVEEIKSDKDIKTALVSASELTVKNSVLEEQRKKQQGASITIGGNNQSSGFATSSSSKSSSSSSAPAVKILPYKTNVFSLADDWKNLFGRTEIINGMLMLGANKSANASTTGSMSVLAGGDNWKKYIFETKLDWLLGSSFSLIARYKDSKNYVSCDFVKNGSYIKITQTKDGVAKTLVRTRRRDILSNNNWQRLKFGIKIDGKYAECLINDEFHLRAFDISTIPDSGGIGFKTWDPVKGVSEALVREVSVNEIQ